MIQYSTVMESSIQQNVITLFRSKGYQKNSYISEYVIRHVLNQRSEQIFSTPFKNEVLVDVLECCKNEKLEFSPFSIGECLQDAYFILKRRINVLKGENGLIEERRVGLDGCKGRLERFRGSGKNNGIFENQMVEEINQIERELTQFENNQLVFQQEIELIQKLFKNFPGNAVKRKRDSELAEESGKKINPRNLSLLFYSGIMGMVLQFMVIELRPGWIAIVVYFQIIFLLLIGYHSKNSVKYLLISDIVSILADGLALFRLQHSSQLLTEQTGFSLAKTRFGYCQFLTICLFLSLVMRVIILILSYALLQPPLTKIEYQIYGNIFSLNARIKIRNHWSNEH